MENLKAHETSLNQKVKRYRKRAKEIGSYLAKFPLDWGRFQSEFNQEINGIFRDLMIFEKEHLERGEEEKVYKLKLLFLKHFRGEFARGDYIKWSLEKPLGYTGDYKIIDDIYRNHPTTTGFDRLYDNYFLMSPASVATRNRKEDFKKIIFEEVSKKNENSLVMNLASAPSRDLQEFFLEYDRKVTGVRFFCVENDPNAIEYSKKLLGDNQRVDFLKENVVRIALRRDIRDLIKENFDIIFSTGLFDYLNSRVATRLVSNLKKLLKPSGLMIISNYRDKYSNPSIHFMEWVGEWNLVYRTEEEFADIFLQSGFSKENLSFQYEQQGIMQYCFARMPN